MLVPEEPKPWSRCPLCGELLKALTITWLGPLYAACECNFKRTEKPQVPSVASEQVRRGVIALLKKYRMCERTSDLQATDEEIIKTFKDGMLNK